MAKKITSREENYSQWYLDVIDAAQLADSSPVRGCMIIRPHGYAIWENIQKELDRMFKETGVKNAYFPLFIPKSFLEKEAKHAEGFAKEVAIVTHHRLKQGENGKLVPDAPLEEPLIVRPTSETIMYDTFSRWIQSYRDLPLLINQWCNVVRWELRTRPFLRTMEFLWQEGHTVHATKEEADRETLAILEIYRKFTEEHLAVPVIAGYKTESEKFAGADYTTCIEAMMQDTKALQAGTSHMLGQNFAKSFEVKFLDEKGESRYAWQTSWGLSTRIIGALIMAHSDDKGLVLPPKIAPIQVVIIPIWGEKEEEKNNVFGAADNMAEKLKNLGLSVETDKRDARPGVKFFEWEKKGVPVRIEIGPKDLEADSMIVVRRDTGEKETVAMDSAEKRIPALLEEIQKGLYEKALKFRKDNMRAVNSWEEFTGYIPEAKEGEAEDAKSGKGGFLLAHWCGQAECEAKIKALTKATIRCIPFDQPEEDGRCVLCGGASKKRVIFAKAY
ncbi:MAG: proline--tRNA ligase [Candidatus Moranbacteria bacterium RIFOXYA2_FULL_43_15]|nr:MAG: proline--tRNA ligase [Candidatus Moranbacteria bacterium RIFOXYA2_FULL_43_15]